MNSKKALKTVGDWISEETHKRKYKKTEIAKLSEALIHLKCITEQQDSRWILVSERLPTIKECQENDCRFIVTDGNRRYQNWFDYEDNYFDRCSCNGLGLKRDICVLAWQSLPEPYKEG